LREIEKKCDEAGRMRGTSVFVRMAARPIPRVTRMMQVARDMGFRCIFVGAFREEGLAGNDNWSGMPIVRVGPYFPLLNGRRPFLYVTSVLRFWISVIRELPKLNPSFVHASDFEAAVPCVIYGFLWRRKVIFNIHDNLAARYPLGFAVAGLLNIFEGILAASSDVTVVPEQFRKRLLPKWAQGNVIIVRNSPVDPGVQQPVPYTERPRVMFAGWLDRGRGLGELIKLASAGSIDLIVAGEGDSRLIAELQSTCGVRYLGFLGHDDVMGETRKCNFVAAFYDPVRPINRLAASNKIAEALALGMPILVNVEMEISGILKSADCAVLLPYPELPNLAEHIRKSVCSEGRYHEMCANARSLYEREYDWEMVRKSMLSVYNAIGISE
jgi:glycosyltransferase involved in cell wall biosynthesis